jgi:geranylgeranyl diphosphate synthase, type II
MRTHSALVRDMLDEYGAAARVRLRDYLAGDEPRPYLYDLAADYPARGGRSLRAGICIATARAFGATTEDALNSAVALEILHNAFLVHDDVEDDSDERRGRPALHILCGTPLAINVGDGLAVMSLKPLIDNSRFLGPRLALRVLQEAERMARESVEGQAMELGWRRDNVSGLCDDDYLRMILKKTCWYTTIYPSRVGALIGTRDGAVLDRYMRFGFFLGAAFQIVDDLLNLLGDPKKYGKEIGGDLWEGKRTLMLLHLLRSAGRREKVRLYRILAMPRRTRRVADVRWIRERMEVHGSIEHGRQFAHAMAGAALHEFSCAYGHVPPSRDKAFLEALPRWMIERL